MGKNFGDIAIQTEGIMFQLEDLQNLLTLFGEHFTDEIGTIDPDQPCTATVFVARLPLMQSFLNVIQNSLSHVIAETEDVHKACCTSTERTG